jgi:hypothetical protein
MNLGGGGGGGGYNINTDIFSPSFNTVISYNGGNGAPGCVILYFS